MAWFGSRFGEGKGLDCMSLGSQGFLNGWPGLRLGMGMVHKFPKLLRLRLEIIRDNQRILGSRTASSMPL
jgi:hypothetical protein